MPARVRAALIALCAAWVSSAVALFVNQVLFHGSRIGPGPSLGTISLAIQAVLFWFVSRGSATARTLVVLVLVVAVLPLGMLSRLITQRELFSASYTLLAFALKGIAVWLLFTGDSVDWFARS
jgi:hypothetical protein